jgi:hypothetical protein
MHRFIYSVLTCLFFSVATSNAFALAFPDAVGFGAGASGGRGGIIIKVTNLNDSGSGSFRAALETIGPRIIVFDVAGTIQLNSNLRVPRGNGNVTIAGQTAPGGGIALARAGLTIIGSNVIVRGLIIRPGDSSQGSEPSNRDAIQIENSDGSGVRNVIIDRNSLTWAVDETLTTWHPGVQNITISNNIIAEGLNYSIHPDYPNDRHSMGLLLGTGTSRVTVYANLISNINERNPQTYADQLEFINNVVYNRRNTLMRVRNQGGVKRTNIINNVFMRGPSWNGSWPVIMIQSKDNADGTTVYMSGNDIGAYPTLSSTSAYIIRTPAFAGTGITPMPPADAKQWVVGNVGARPWNRDAVDARLVNQIVTNSGGAMIDSPSQVGGYPILRGTAPVDSDGDGMPDAWEIQRGLNPNAASDAHLDRNGDGFTNIEEYINSFYEPARPGIDLNPPFLRIVSTE